MTAKDMPRALYFCLQNFKTSGRVSVFRYYFCLYSRLGSCPLAWTTKPLLGASLGRRLTMWKWFPELIHIQAIQRQAFHAQDFWSTLLLSLTCLNLVRLDYTLLEQLRTRSAHHIRASNFLVDRPTRRRVIKVESDMVWICGVDPHQLDQQLQERWISRV